MTPESLAEVARRGNVRAVEEQWIGAFESGDSDVVELAEYRAVLAELVGLRRVQEAETLAWAAIEAVSANHTAAETLRVAGPFLLVANKSNELRAQVTELYREVHEGREGLDALLKEAGIAGGRPPRRALRTLETCLPLNVGDYLIARDEDRAARVEAINTDDWTFSIDVDGRPETLGAVNLADEYYEAPADDFHIMRHFFRDDLVNRLKKDAASVVVDICRRQGGHITKESLQEILVPGVLTEAEWKRWWTSARTAMKRSPHLKIGARAPYDIEYMATPRDLAAEMSAAFEAARGAMEKWNVVDAHVRHCKQCHVDVNTEAMHACFTVLSEHATAALEAGGLEVGLWWVIVQQVGEMAGADEAAEGALTYLRDAADVQAVLGAIPDEHLQAAAVDLVLLARPDDGVDSVLDAFPGFPASVCEHAVSKLVDAGCGPEAFAAPIQRVLASPVQHADALLWLWTDPARRAKISDLASVTVLSRILTALEECQRNDSLSKELTQHIASRTRAVLSAKKYEHYQSCLADIEPGMALALRTRVRRLANLGQTVHDRLLNIVSKTFPQLDAEPELKAWEREDVLFVTAEGMRRRQNEIDEHVNVKMKENARAIGEAAAKGDLSENSEYKFALEERDLLRARLAQMNSELEIAQVLEPADVPVEYVGIGTEVRLARVDDGEPYTICFLGPWDADNQHGIVNYLAPLAQRVLGKRVGDRIEFEHTGAKGTYEIKSLHNALT